MCRLFGMSAAPHRVHATFWLLEASDSLAQQSRREPDGTGLGTFAADGSPQVDKEPIAAFQDAEFAREAKERESVTFIAHIRYASTGGLQLRNTHPFEQHGRLFAHNGVVEGLDTLEVELGAYRDLVDGDTDSERVFALITQRTDRRGGDVGAGITDAVQWLSRHVPIYAVNLVLTTPTEMWALRYPDTHPLYMLERRAGGPHGHRHLDHASPAGTVRTRSGELAEHPAVIVASERMDEDPGWRALKPGELLHVDSRLNIKSRIVLADGPRHLLTLDQLNAGAAASQTAQ